MLTTLRKILKTKGIPIQDSIYGRATDTVLDFPMNIGDFFLPKSDGSGVGEFKLLNRLNDLIEDKKKASEYSDSYSQLQQTENRLKEMKNLKNNNNDELIAEKLELRKNKHRLQETIAVLDEKYLTQSTEEIKKKYSFGFAFLQYKDSFFCSTFTEIAAILPQVEDVNNLQLRKMPLFVRGLRDLSVALEGAAPLGIVGGPCLFGAHEVVLDIYHADGSRVQFDFSTGRNFDRGILAEDDLESYLSINYEDIIHLGLTNYKRGVTYQEYLSMQYLFEFAVALGGKVVIPIPDMSYMKFFKGITTPIASEIKTPAFKVFEQISHDITDMYLEVIDELQLQYPEVECQVLHSRNVEICDLFYDKRQPFVSKLSRQGRVTEYVGRTEAIIDYITMLALPYYVYGTHHVLQIDSVAEADSMRKCMKIHNPELNFHSILFPEYLSEDGMHTIYNAPLEFTDYVYAGR
ncbi:MAG: hypothetical protein GX796_01195 [Clostridiaceae bacterium]|nr:hypothetical protein [Clostridiaceae bacterium]